MEPSQVAAVAPLAVGYEGLDAVVSRYAGYGPFVASFLANMLATFGDKGQLVVFMLASRYDAKRVFLGATTAFALWSAVEVALGQWIVRVLPGSVIGRLTGGLFLVFGVWTLVAAARHVRQYRYGSRGPAVADGAVRPVRFLPDRVVDAVSGRGGLVTAFVFVLFAEFGDKTQALTINLAATFPDAPVAVFAGVVAALALRTGIDAWVGERFERWVPTRYVELLAGAVFLAFGFVVLGLLPETALFVTLAAVVALATAFVVRALVRGRRGTERD